MAVPRAEGKWGKREGGKPGRRTLSFGSPYRYRQVALSDFTK